MYFLIIRLQRRRPGTILRAADTGTRKAKRMVGLTSHVAAATFSAIVQGRHGFLWWCGCSMGMITDPWSHCSQEGPYHVRYSEVYWNHDLYLTPRVFMIKYRTTRERSMLPMLTFGSDHLLRSLKAKIKSIALRVRPHACCSRLKFILCYSTNRFPMI